MDKESANPIVHDVVGSKRDASLFDAVPSTAVAAADASEAAVGGRQIPPGFDPYEEVPYISPPNPGVGNNDEDRHTKTRRIRGCSRPVISYFAKGVYRCPFCTLLGGTDFSCLLTHAEDIGKTFPKVGTTMNVYSFRAKHKALDMQLRNFQRVEIAAGACLRSIPRKFKMSMMGELKYFLGFQVRQLPSGTFVSQEKYVKNMLKKFYMTKSNTAKTPMPLNGQLGSCEDEQGVDQKEFRPAGYGAGIFWLVNQFADLLAGTFRRSNRSAGCYDEYSSDDLVIGDKRKRTEKTERPLGFRTNGRVPRGAQGGPGGSRSSATKLKTIGGKNKGQGPLPPLKPSGGVCRRRALDSFDRIPTFYGRMRRWARPRVSGPVSAKTSRIHEHVPPRAEAGTEFVDKLRPRAEEQAVAIDDGSSRAPPPSASGPEVQEKKVSVLRRYAANLCSDKFLFFDSPLFAKLFSGCFLPTISFLFFLGRRAQARLKTSGSKVPLGPSTPPHQAGTTVPGISASQGHTGRACGPTSSDHRTEEDPSFFLENQDTGTSNISLEKLPGVEPPAPLPLRKDNSRAGILAREAPTGGASTAPFSTDHPHAAAKCSWRQPSVLLPRHGKTSSLQGKRGSRAPLTRASSPWCCTSPRPPSSCLGHRSSWRIAASSAERDRGHLTPREKWNARISLRRPRQAGRAAARPRWEPLFEEHFTRPRCAVKEGGYAWYGHEQLDGAFYYLSQLPFPFFRSLLSFTFMPVSLLSIFPLTADARKTLFEELLWEHRELVEAHDKCQVLPEASIDALKEQLANAQLEKEQLIKQHQEELSAQKTSYQELKSQLIQLGLEHAKILEA
ncbi:hypothetical protein QYE76_014716 [Lolium multiflorum]|uniref:Reverse transcriptase Ty1/copia-type domain-containing protein n=1 Tax=Lolium multiflorum TaxID=4521 RepID=A0AAD8U590_LOLMU|nr:hypothetical protein QYE76_014716 [Lolium multiflorum]